MRPTSSITSLSERNLRGGEKAISCQGSTGPLWAYAWPIMAS
jgi:hypothetical protein